ncbi:hypothetical protein SAMN05444165_7095 [Paraburkholderia phenazinium]|uniref:Uncharacterized protein n=1 Tax=Paraburkholderia phenazinium TaxID=60549 RepID=A0A1N6LFQ4_9BURK|nr:hypothetical protein SAMN05444165_7095 [Paraburkholderia phenazinium]
MWSNSELQAAAVAGKSNHSSTTAAEVLFGGLCDRTVVGAQGQTG